MFSAEDRTTGNAHRQVPREEGELLGINLPWLEVFEQFVDHGLRAALDLAEHSFEEQRRHLDRIEIRMLEPVEVCLARCRLG